MPRGTVLYLVRPLVCLETKHRLVELLSDDDVIGLAYAAWRRREFGIGVVGEARRQPLLAHAMVLTLEEELRRLHSPGTTLG